MPTTTTEPFDGAHVLQAKLDAAALQRRLRLITQANTNLASYGPAQPEATWFPASPRWPTDHPFHALNQPW